MSGWSGGRYSSRVGVGRGHVLLVIRLLSGRRGGAERVYSELADVLCSAGYQVTCAYCDSTEAGPAYPLPPRVRVVNLYRPAQLRSRAERLLLSLARPYPRVGALAPVAWLSRNAGFILSLRRLIQEDMPDVVISFLPSANTPSLIAGAMCGANVVVTNHGEPEQDYRSAARWDQNPVDRWLRYRTLWLAARIQVLSQVHREWFPQALKPRTIAIPNGLAAEFRHQPLTTQRERAIVAVGRLVPEKCQARLVEAFRGLASRFPDWSVRIYGDGPERVNLTAQIQSCGLTGRVHLMGQTDAIREAYSAGQIFCHSSRHEGFGLAMLEALACGLPVVAFAECQAARQLVRHGENGLLVGGTNDPGALANALARLMTDEALRQKLATAAPSSNGQFAGERFGAHWCGLVDALVEQRSREAPARRLVA